MGGPRLSADQVVSFFLQKQLAELDKRCISLLNELEESHSLDLEDRSVAGFLTEMETYVVSGLAC